MKKFIFTLLISAMFFNSWFCVTAKSFAYEDNYGRVVTEGVGFYKNPNPSDLVFYLPYTYYVKVLSVGTPYSLVEVYGKNDQGATLDGYVLTSELTLDNYGIENPFLDLTVTTATTTNLYTDASLSKISRSIFEGRNLTYYGYLLDDFGGYIYFVKYNDQTGYVKESDVTPFTVPLHEIPLIIESPKPPEETPLPQKNTGLDGLKTAIIVCLCLASIIVAVAFFKPKKQPTVINYYDENDYE